MGISRFDTRQRAHEGVDVPLVIDGETAYGPDNQPITFRIKGIHDPEVHRVILQLRKGDDSRTPEEVLSRDMKLARAAVVGWSDNLTLDDDEEVIPFTRENLEKVFAIPAVRRAILAEVLNEQLFMKKG